MKLAALTVAALLASAGSALAHSSSVIDTTQAQQRHRIEHGRYTGALTRHEFRRLMAEQRAIADMERAAKADGVLSRREFRAIRAAQHEPARNIHAQMHDAQFNPWRKWSSRHR